MNKIRSTLINLSIVNSNFDYCGITALSIRDDVKFTAIIESTFISIHFSMFTDYLYIGHPCDLNNLN